MSGRTGDRPTGTARISFEDPVTDAGERVDVTQILTGPSTRLDPRDAAFIRASAGTIATWGEAPASLIAALAPDAQVVSATAGGQADIGVSIHDLEGSSDPLARLTEQLAGCASVLIAVVTHNAFPLPAGHRAQLRPESFPERVGGFFRLDARVIEDGARADLLVVYGSASYLDARYASIDPHDAERAKWDAVYAGAPPAEAHSTPGFNEELAECVVELLEPGDSVLEAGCGQGNGSLAIARKDMFSVNVLDFSENALRYARALFEREGLEAKSFILDDVFAPTTTDRSDLVFNAGSLEHYTFDEQVAFLRGMAKMSRRYVLVLWPNRECYWYWIWRIRAASQQGWSFGKEVPSTDMDAALRAAGLHPIGHRPFGAASTKNILMRLSGLSDDLRSDLLRIHDSPVLPLRNKAYLVAALASVEAPTGPPLPGWGEPEHDEMQLAELTAALADAMAMNIAAQRANVTLDKARAAAVAATTKARADGEQHRRALARAEQRVAAVQGSTVWRIRSRLVRILARLRRR